MPMPYDILVIAGPTASGKSALALQIARMTGGEIVSADSVQVYKHLNIGTAKPTPRECAEIPHHVLGFVELTDNYSAARFQADAYAAIDDIRARGKLPIVCGGTGLYINAVLYPMQFTQSQSDAAYRAELEELYEEQGASALHERLKAVDSITASRLHPRDKVRIIRALEVYHSTGQPFSQHATNFVDAPPRYRYLLIGATLPRETLYQRIDERVLSMMGQGWVQELQQLQQSYDPNLRPFQTLGYKQISAMLRGEMDYEEVVQDTQRETRRFSKRQLTWFKRLPGLEWVDMAQAPMQKIAQQVLEMYKNGAE